MGSAVSKVLLCRIRKLKVQQECGNFFSFLIQKAEFCPHFDLSVPSKGPEDVKKERQVHYSVLLEPSNSIFAKAGRVRAPSFCEHLLSPGDAVSLLRVGAEPLLLPLQWQQRGRRRQNQSALSLWLLWMLRGGDTLLRCLCTYPPLGHNILYLCFYFSSSVTSVCSRESSAFFPCHLPNSEC